MSNQGLLSPYFFFFNLPMTSMMSSVFAMRIILFPFNDQFLRDALNYYSFVNLIFTLSTREFYASPKKNVMKCENLIYNTNTCIIVLKNEGEKVISNIHTSHRYRSKQIRAAAMIFCFYLIFNN
jgi:hypothetical protein